MSAAKERPTAHHSAQRHSLKYLDCYDLIRKVVGLHNPAYSKGLCYVTGKPFRKVISGEIC